MNINTLVVFHRCGGKSLNYPPNALITIEWAIKFGAKAIEYDVVYCKDDTRDKIIVAEPKLIKSVNLDINNLQWNDIRKLNAGNEKFGYQNVPELEEVLTLVSTTNIQQQIHIKGNRPKTLEILLNKLRNTNNFSITSFDIGLLKRIKDISNTAKVGWLVKPKQEKDSEGGEDLTAFVTANAKAFLNYSEKETKDIINIAKKNMIDIIILCGPRIKEKTVIKTVKSQGFEVGAWGVGTNLDLAKQLIQFNIDRFTIDNPEQFSFVLRLANARSGH
ncbi:hypothetical protein CO007_05935 [Candidatus Roizmanbacteria bacterium CG_4_8_14_3_um_filter_36_10]|uniref:GP-PDE domain-containing protein n=1 Tax=Candidatus Roizmanbacteria bacterium CG_4_8_14_3_um_filter_36_10 TaxID=1974834 RepID=A0A2M8GKV8_9BACT|nr:MAG: hypothetical protein CO007_05935 [Candidatus Roizmanbacteria bacterium CG_4_8_14_3_um_filter_36_10]